MALIGRPLGKICKSLTRPTRLRVRHKADDDSKESSVDRNLIQKLDFLALCYKKQKSNPHHDWIRLEDAAEDPSPRIPDLCGFKNGMWKLQSIYSQQIICEATKSDILAVESGPRVKPCPGFAGVSRVLLCCFFPLETLSPRPAVIQHKHYRMI